jgi:RND family efflux transporter MFP subunit
LYVYFNLNELDLLRVMKMVREQAKKDGVDIQSASADAKPEVPLHLGLADEEGYPHEGVVDYGASGLDPETGTLQLRGVFANPGRRPTLLPGLFARLRMPVQERENALLVTERAVGADQGGRYVLVVVDDNVVEKRTVRMGQNVDGLLIVEEGLQAGEQVVVKGMQRARPGASVDPQPVEMESFTTSAIRAAAEAGADSAQASEGETAAAREDEGPAPDTAAE